MDGVSYFDQWLDPGKYTKCKTTSRNSKRHRWARTKILNLVGPDQKAGPGAAAAADGPPSTQNTSKLPPLVHCRCPRPSWTNARPRGCACWALLGSGSHPPRATSGLEKHFDKNFSFFLQKASQRPLPTQSIQNLGGPSVGSIYGKTVP